MARNKYDVDENLETSFDISQLKRLYNYIKPYKKDILITITIMVISSGLGMLTPVILMRILQTLKFYVQDMCFGFMAVKVKKWI